MNHTFCWIDIPVTDLDRAIAFYSGLLEHPVEKISEHGFEFGLLPHEDDNVSGCLTVMDDRKPSRNGPLVYLNVEGKLQRAVESVDALGGKVLQSVMKIGPYGHRAVVMDTEGNVVALYSKHLSSDK